MPGRAAHVTRLRNEFDTGEWEELVVLPRVSFKCDFTGADYDMSGCTPGDLDPHAVASVFKAYLREREYCKYVCNHQS